MTKSKIELALAERIIVAILGGMVSTHSTDEVISIIDNLARQRETLKGYFEAARPMIPDVQERIEKIRNQAEVADDFYINAFAEIKDQ